MAKIDDYLISKVFTVPYIDKMMMQESDSDAFFKCVKRFVKEENATTYGEAISEIYHYMDGAYRNEYFYKNTVFNELLLKKHDLYETAALTELPIADSKADFVMINGKGVVYEIKTDLDTFNRLEMQLDDYYKAFKYVNVVVSNKQYVKAKELLEDTPVGIYVLGESGSIRCRKKAVSYREKLSYEIIFRILRKPEFESILLKHFGKLPQVSSFQYYRTCLEWVQKINILTFQKEMLQCLKQRTVLTIDNTLKESVPYELRFYAYFTKKYNKKYERINEFLSQKMEV